MPKADIAIVTVIPEEYTAVISRLEKQGCILQHDRGSASHPNQNGWVTSELTDQFGRVYRLVVAAAILPGPTQMACAVSALVARFKPRHVLLVGIAGGFPLDGQARGDVAISSVIYDYEYGKVAEDFSPRHDSTYQVDGALLRSAVTLHARDADWSALDNDCRPGELGRPNLRSGVVASGSKVVDNSDNTFFARVLEFWPKILAVEMEGVGAVAAVNAAVSGGRSVGFLMIRGISDMPKIGSQVLAGSMPPERSSEGNKAERDTWKKYAAIVAANFTIHWINRGWPVAPARRATRPSSSTPPSGGADSQCLPAAVKRPEPSSVEFDPFAGKTDSSIWLGYTPTLTPKANSNATYSMGEPVAEQAVLGAIAERVEKTASVPASAFDQELEIIQLNIDQYQIDVAEAKLKDLEVRAAHGLQPRQWYHLKALRSRIFSSRCQWEQAGRELLDAKRHTPDTERARVNEALGYELLGQKEKAHALATALRVEFTQSVRLVTIWTRTAPEAVTFDSLRKIAEPFAKEDEELNLALAYRALQEGRFDEAVSFAVRATTFDSNSPHAWLVLGEVKHSTALNATPGRYRELLREAEQYYDQAILLSQQKKLPGLEAAIRFNRGRVRHLLGEFRAESDFQRAIELGRPDQRIRTGYAGFLIQLDRPADALRELEAEAGEPNGEHIYLEATARYERNIGDDRERAHALLLKFISSKVSDRWDDAHILLVKWAVANKTQFSARDTINRSGLQDVNPFVFHTLIGWLSDSENDNEIARAALLKALDSLNDRTRLDHIFLLAQALVSVEDDALALPLLERCYTPGVLNYECKKLLDAARRLQRHDVLRRICRELREAGSSDDKVIETEISILQMYDPEEASELRENSSLRILETDTSRCGNRPLHLGLNGEN